LLIALSRAPGSQAGPILCGVEMIAEESPEAAGN
jgi:hypothetical protein